MRGFAWLNDVRNSTTSTSIHSDPPGNKEGALALTGNYISGVVAPQAALYPAPCASIVKRRASPTALIRGRANDNGDVTK